MKASVSEQDNYIQDDIAQFCLADGAELFTGLNDVPMLHLAKQDKYIRLSPLGADIITMFNNNKVITSGDIIRALVALYPNKQPEIPQKVAAFLLQLENTGAITSLDKDITEKKLDKKVHRLSFILSIVFYIFRFIQKRPMIRIGIWHPGKPVADKFFSKLRQVKLGIKCKLLFCIWFSFAIIVSGYNTIHMGMFFNTAIAVWPLVIGVLLIHLTLHELCHVFVSSYYKVKIRSVGVGLLYYVLPFFYMDRTDSYRLRNAKHHMYISLAGPVFDISAATLSALIATTTTGWMKASFHILLVTQVVTFIIDINPLLPSDGYRILEALLKTINLRQRAFQTVLCVLTRKKLPPQLSVQSTKIRYIYFIYGILSSAWIAFLVSYITIWYFTTGLSLTLDWLLPTVKNILAR